MPPLAAAGPEPHEKGCVEMSMSEFMAARYTEYLALCEKQGETPDRTDFFGYLYGFENGTHAASRPDYGGLYAKI